MMKDKKHSAGFITVDFIFALITVFGLSTLLFALTFTLSVVEVVQYITFSSARSFYAAHLGKEKQKEMGIKKYQSLLANKVFAPLFRAGGWFELKGGPGFDESLSGAWNDVYPGNSNPTGKAYLGSRVKLVANLMNIRIPILGNTGEKPFAANVSSFLSREPNEDECMAFMAQRLNFLLQKPEFAGGTGIDREKYFFTPDNGC
ncbi:MAG: hypothetical protein SGJ18_14395 [Pseudomonadota bacterium]|mgnify:CR=1 FL=1|nr:hypothetical protein [Pseudomonadota bacterium]